MSRPTVDGIKALISDRARDLKSLSLSWFGGEPLLVPDIVLEIARHAQSICDGTGIAFGGDVTTNGSLLTSELLERLVAANQSRFQITLDGWEEGHDKTRRRASGRGTFRRVWNALLMMKRSTHSIRTVIRVHLTPHNHASVKRLVSELSTEFGKDSRFSLFYKAVAALGGQHDSTNEILECDEAETAISELRDISDGASATLPDLAAQDELSGQFICYAARPNSLVIRADGRIGKCTVALDAECNQIGNLQSDGTLTINNEKLSPWLRGILLADKISLACPLSNWPTAQSAQIDCDAVHVETGIQTTGFGKQGQTGAWE